MIYSASLKPTDYIIIISNDCLLSAWGESSELRICPHMCCFIISSTGLREEQSDEGDKPIVPGFLEVMDLLRNLPEAIRSPLLLSKDPTITTIITTTTTITTSTTTSSQRGSKVEQQTSLPQQEGTGAVYTIAGRTVVRGVTQSSGQMGASPLHRREEKTTACWNGIHTNTHTRTLSLTPSYTQTNIRSCGKWELTLQSWCEWWKWVEIWKQSVLRLVPRLVQRRGCDVSVVVNYKCTTKDQ